MTMKKPLIWIVCTALLGTVSYAQDEADQDDKDAISVLIDQYSQARETKDTLLLKQILTQEVDQLVSSGEWRRGIKIALEGMLRSSTSNPGDRTLTIDQVRFLNKATAVVDARYEIRNADGSTRKMWSTFIVVNEANRWKIIAIRNMLPAKSS